MGRMFRDSGQAKPMLAVAEILIVIPENADELP
jgi:hypothetical protein